MGRRCSCLPTKQSGLVHEISRRWEAMLTTGPSPIAGGGRQAGLAAPQRGRGRVEGEDAGIAGLWLTPRCRGFAEQLGQQGGVSQDVAAISHCSPCPTLGTGAGGMTYTPRALGCWVPGSNNTHSSLAGTPPGLLGMSGDSCASILPLDGLTVRPTRRYLHRASRCLGD